MPFAAERKKLPPHDQITELQRKIQLLDGDKTAFYESSQSAMKKNRESILQLRQDNKRLYRKVAEAKAGDEHIIRVAFQNKGLKQDAFHNMSGKAALTAVDQKVLSKTKRLNASKHTTRTYQQRLDELKREYERIKPEGGSGAVSSSAWERKKEEDVMNLHALENRLEKTQFKSKEAENITSYYQKLKTELQDESLTFQGQLDSLEAEILKYRKELHSLQVMRDDAQLSEEAAKAAFQQQDELLSRERKERERAITSYRKIVEEHKAETGKTERSVKRTPLQPDELSSEAQHSTTRIPAEEEKAFSALEEAFERIKETTGATDVQEIVKRFTSQKEMHEHLEKLKKENEEALLQLKEQRELLIQRFEEEEYSGDAKLSCEQQKLEEAELQLQAHQQRCDSARERLDWLTTTLSTVTAGVEHLAEKLQHITLSAGRVTAQQPDSEEAVLELLAQCELQLQLLQKEFEGKDLTAIMKEMGEDEFYIRIEENLPEYNTRVRLPEAQPLELSDDAAKRSDEDEPGVLSREVLKRQSQLIVDSNLKKKTWKRKKSKFWPKEEI
ncbi:coiled-coil domain-containing protein 151 [Nothobranchius furzeri]|uniref:Coiled-coil domain containing 151 n=3 Tax=Nothobranchius TaxID=28779 RepID=A0A1A8A1H7_NOTFU|nr:transcript variant X1 [Nothobranchius furzeri]